MDLSMQSECSRYAAEPGLPHRASHASGSRKFIALLVFTWCFPVGLALAKESGEFSLFTCQTDRAGKVVSVIATEKADGNGWEKIQYRFGQEGEKPEFVYPTDPSRGAALLHFSHTLRGADYRVTVRFESAGFIYRVYSNSEEESAGVQVFDRRNKLVSTARCVERPQMFTTYLRRALACDREAAHGPAACQEQPLRIAR